MSSVVGRRFTRLLVIAQKGKHAAYLCQCGKRGTVAVSSLLSGRTRSCGCLRAELVRVRNTSHGASSSQFYKVWSSMIQRVTNPNNKRWKDYGGRGIGVEDRWRVFENFAADMRPRPPGAMLDREDNNGPYSKKNCRWVTTKISNGNKRGVAVVTYAGERKTLPEVAAILGISVRAMQRRAKGDRSKMFRLRGKSG